MIRPLDNWKAVRALDVWYWFPPISFLRRSILARKCLALARADRMLSEADK
nr:MAG TPA: hypothetical protein [Caudoviricetes sp.]